MQTDRFDALTRSLPMPPLTGFARYDTQRPEAYSWVAGRYFFGCFNPDIGLPEVWVGDDGSTKGHCHRGERAS